MEIILYLFGGAIALGIVWGILTSIFSAIFGRSGNSGYTVSTPSSPSSSSSSSCGERVTYVEHDERGNRIETVTDGSSTWKRHPGSSGRF